MFDLSKPNVGAAGVAPYSIIYGQNGIGKSTLAAMPPNTVFADIERGMPEKLRHIPRFPVDNLSALITLIDQLITQQHPFAHLVIDSGSALSAKLKDDICKEQKWTLPDGRNDMGEKGYSAYGRGEKIEAEKFALLNDRIIKLRDTRNVATTLLGHVRQVKVRPPDNEEYSRYDIALPAGAIEVITQRADIVGFLSYPVSVIKQDGQRSGPGKAVGQSDARLYLKNAASHNAKNRFDMPDYITIPQGNPADGFAEYGKHIPYFAPLFANRPPAQQANGAVAA